MILHMCICNAHNKCNDPQPAQWAVVPVVLIFWDFMVVIFVFAFVDCDRLANVLGSFWVQFALEKYMGNFDKLKTIKCIILLRLPSLSSCLVACHHHHQNHLNWMTALVGSCLLGPDKLCHQSFRRLRLQRLGPPGQN